jgi:hypothetical protein
MLSSALQCAVPVLEAMGRHEAAALIAGAHRGGVATGVRRERLGALVGDLGIDEALHRAREALGEEAYQDAFDRGGRFSFDEAVSFVLSALDVAGYSAP